MISAAVPSFWGSPLEDPSSARSTNFAVSEGLAYGLLESAELQFAAVSTQESHDVFCLEELPLIDESLFDLVEVPELEDVELAEQSSPSAIVPLNDLILEEIPSLEDPCVEAQTSLTENLQQPWSDWTLAKFEQSSSSSTTIDEQWKSQETLTAPDVATPILLVNEEPVCEKEEIVTTSPIYAESSGSESPLSCYSVVSDELVTPAEKRRRVSQISMSSYCSSTGDSTWSPTSASDSDVDSRRGGRKSKFTPEDRKERKKAQNRNAAERYRQKRKVQEETIDEEEQQLIDGNNELKTEVTKLQAEVSCLKRLMREMLQAKGVKIPSSPKRKLTV